MAVQLREGRGECHFDLHYCGETAAKFTYRFTRLGVYIDSDSPRAWARGWRGLLSHSCCYKAWIDCAEAKQGLTTLQPRSKSGPDSTKNTLRIRVLLITNCPMQQPNRNHRIIKVGKKAQPSNCPHYAHYTTTLQLVSNGSGELVGKCYPDQGKVVAAKGMSKPLIAAMGAHSFQGGDGTGLCKRDAKGRTRIFLPYQEAKQKSLGRGKPYIQ